MENNTPQNPPPSQISQDVPIDEPPERSFPIKLIAIILGAVFILAVVAVLAYLFFMRKPPEQEDVELTYWGIWEDEAVYKELIDEFERKHPNVTVKYEKQDIIALDDYVARLNTRIKGGTGPDVLRFHNSWVKQLNGVLQPLPQSVIQATEFESQYYDVIKNDMNKNGAYVGIPLSIDTLALFVNDDIFQEAGYSPPTEWGEFLDKSRLLTTIQEDSGESTIVRPGAALGTFDNVFHAPDIIGLLLLQSGVDPSAMQDPSNQQRAVDALEYYTCFAKDTQVCKKIWDEEQDNSKLAFTKGNLPMYFGYSWDIFEIKTLNPRLNFKVLPVPKLGTKSNTIASYWAEGVSVGSKHPKEAFMFIEFLASKESLQKLYAQQSKTRLFGGLYPRKDLAKLLESNKLIYPFVQQAENARSTIFYANTFDGKGGANTILNEALNGAITSILRGDPDTPTAVETLSKQINDELSKHD